MSSQQYTRKLQATQECRDGVIFPRGEQTNWLSGTKWSTLKIFIQLRFYRLSGLYLEKNIYIHIQVCMYNNN